MQIPGKYQSFSPLTLKPWILSLFATLETRKSWNAYQLFVGSLLAPARYWSIFYLFLVTVPEVLTKYLVPVSISFLLKVVNGWPRETEEVATIIHDECNDQSQFRRTPPFQLQKIWKTSFCVELLAAGVGISKIVAICWCVQKLCLFL